MLYTNDGTLAIDDRPAPRGLFTAERRAARERREQLAGIYEEMRQMAEEIAAIEEAASVELEQLGCIEMRPQFDWSRKARPDERGSMAAIVAICTEEYLPSELY